MAKAQRIYTGHDTAGRSIELAERTDGVWFWREYCWNGYGMGWSKWEAYGKEPIFPAKVRNMCDNADAPDFFEIPEEDKGNQVEWGFNLLRIVPGPHRIRLPNP